MASSSRQEVSASYWGTQVRAVKPSVTPSIRHGDWHLQTHTVEKQAVISGMKLVLLTLPAPCVLLTLPAPCLSWQRGGLAGREVKPPSILPGGKDGQRRHWGWVLTGGAVLKPAETSAHPRSEMVYRSFSLENTRRQVLGESRETPGACGVLRQKVLPPAGP
ncbi:hypothetical protein HJG60_008727 [Phyllostomus discolor]|uniref:Uncharacterized protein n=1 Tax=Phyllostomus discolor TaxID=89673 RepID=A0A833YWD6_9CHIR|nr:hypothetical protein HJG60_008727 [Phyllostomus discolor]